MAKKRQVRHEPQINEHFRRETEIKANGRNVERGTELSFRGVRGRYRFWEYVETPETSWVTVVGGTAGVKQFRSFAFDRIKTVHSKDKLR